MKKFVAIMNKGFHTTFENGYTVSVQWGAGNYCDNYFPKDKDFSCKKPAESNTAEVAAFDPRDEFVDLFKVCPDLHTDGIVAGYLTPEEVLAFMNRIAALPSHP